MLELLRNKARELLQAIQLEFPQKELEQDYRALREQNMIRDFKMCLMFLTMYNLVVIIISSIFTSWIEVYACSGTILIVLPIYLFQAYLKKYIQVLTLLIILSFNISRLILTGFHLDSSSKATLFYVGYSLASLEVILLFRLLRVSQKILGVAIALFLRFFIVTAMMDNEEFPGTIFVRHLIIDGYVCYTFYDHEITLRKMYLDIVQKKEELLKFKELLAEALPQSLVVVKYLSNDLLFCNKAFQNAFPMYQNRKLIKAHLNSLIVDPTTIRDINNCSSPLPLADSKHPLPLAQVFTEMSSKDFLNNKTIFFSASISQNSTRRLFEVTLKKVKWDSEDAIAVMFNDVSYQENIVALKLANLNKDKVLATVSHELRTPLNGIIGILDATRKQVKDPQISDHLSLCEDNAHLLLNLVNSVLDLQQISAGKFRLNPNNVDIRKFINSLAKIFHFQCKEKGLLLEANIRKDVPTVISTDANRLKQVLINLIGNAVKFTSKGTIKIKVTPSSRNSTALLLSVSDTGIGIEKADQKRLSEMYNKMDNFEGANKNGVGLGLTISNTLAIRLNGGQGNSGLEIDSVYGMGSKFYFEIKKNLKEKKPVESAKTIFDIEEKNSSNQILEDTNAVHPLLTRTVESREEHKIENDSDYLRDNTEEDYKEFFASPNLKSKLSHYVSPNLIKTVFNDAPQSKTAFTDSKDDRLTLRPTPMTLQTPTNLDDDKTYEVHILFVDDNPFNLLVAKNIIQEFGCKIQTALGGQEAIDLVKSNLSEGIVFKVIFMDCQMPVMDGFETTQILNGWIKSGEIPDIAIFGWTANNGEADVKRCYEVGMRGHLPKPTSKADFLRVLSSL